MTQRRQLIFLLRGSKQGGGRLERLQLLPACEENLSQNQAHRGRKLRGMKMVNRSEDPSELLDPAVSEGKSAMGLQAGKADMVPC